MHIGIAVYGSYKFTSGNIMRHGHKLPRFSGTTKRRAALLKNLATALVKHERITTTVAKAKAMKKYGDKVT